MAPYLKSVLQTQYLTVGIQVVKGDTKPTLSAIWVKLQCLNTTHYSADKVDKTGQCRGRKSHTTNKSQRKCPDLYKISPSSYQVIASTTLGDRTIIQGPMVLNTSLLLETNTKHIQLSSVFKE